METIRFTDKQIETALNFLKNAKLNKGKESAYLYYHFDTPNQLYVKYQTYGISDDNSIWAENKMTCINEQGETSDCYADFNGIAQKLAFDRGLIEIEIDEDKKLKLV